MSASELCCRCGNAEDQILNLLNSTDLSTDSFDPQVLAQYYLLGQGGNLTAIAKRATGVDFRAVENTVSTTVANTIAVSRGAVLYQNNQKHIIRGIVWSSSILCEDFLSKPSPTACC